MQKQSPKPQNNKARIGLKMQTKVRAGQGSTTGPSNTERYAVKDIMVA